MTEVIFVDTFAWVAVINKSDNYHKICLKNTRIISQGKSKIYYH